MKIVITESQIKSLKESLLLEASDDVLTYTTKYDQKLYRWDNRLGMMNYLVWQNVPAGTKFKMVIKDNSAKIQAWKGSLEFYCSENKYYTKNDTFKGDALTTALRNKFCSGKSYKKELVNTFYDKETEGDLNEVQDQLCMSKIKVPYQNAMNWWKNKLNEPAFYSKLKTLNNYTDQQTKDWITKYKNYLTNNVSGPFCPKQHSKLYKEYFSRVEPKGHSPNAIAFLTGEVGSNRIVYNSYFLKDEKDMEATLVHEMQHALYDLKPMTPHENWKKVFPYKVWAKNDSGEGRVSTINPSETNNIVTKYGIDKTTLDDWSLELKYRKNKNYVCRDTELASRVVAMKNLLKYGSKDNITVNDFKKFIKDDETPYDDENAFFIVLCWVDNGMPDIQTFVNNLNKYVVAKVEPGKDDDMKDQTT
jgi:hypothetical protein